MHSIWNFFLERKAFTWLVLISLLAAGAYAIIALPKESNPEVKIPTAIVSTVLPGATAADVERLVTDKLEPSIRTVSNVKTVTSSSRQNVSQITVEFNQSADLDVAVQDLRNAVERSKGDLPTDAESPIVTKLDFSDQPVLQVGIGTDLPPETLTKLGEDLEDDLRNVPGVYKVETSGARSREISVVVHKNALSTYGITLAQVSNAIAVANAAAPSGTITMDGVDYPLQFKGELASAEDVRNAPITDSVRVGDVATVVDGYANTNSISRLTLGSNETQYALSLSVYKSDDASILDVANRTKARLAELQHTLLSGSDYVITFNAADEVRKSISDLFDAGVVTILLVAGALFIAIGAREALVAAIAVPLSFVIAFVGMLVIGETINFVSLFALIIAIGILVDSAIVIVEGIHTNRDKGLDREQAAHKAITDFSWPLIAGTMTTVAVFVPLLFLSGIIGEFIKHVPSTIILVLLASIVVALGFIPLISILVVRKQHSKFAVYREWLWTTLERYYRATMTRVFKSRTIQRNFFIFLAASFIGGIVLVGVGAIKMTMFPASDSDLFYVEVEMPQATTLHETDLLTRQVEEVLAEKTPYLESLMTTVGASSQFSGSGPSANNKLANITVNLISKEDGRKISSLEVTEQLRKELAMHDFGTAKVAVHDAENGPPSGAPIVVKVWSDDSTTLAMALDSVQGVVEKTPKTRDVASSLSNDGTEITIHIDRQKAQDYGLSAAMVARTLQSAIAGVEAAKVREGGDDIKVRVSLDLNGAFVNPEDTTITDADAIATIPVATARGIVPLGTLLTITANRSASVINHEDGKRIGTVSSYVVEDANAVEVTNAIRAQVATIDLPQGVYVTYGGDDEDIKKMFTELMAALLAGLVSMFAILVLEFNAFRTSLRLLSAIPLSLAGVLWGLFVAGQPLSFTAFLGIIALAGVLINHGILLLDVLSNRREQQEGHTYDPGELILSSASSRLRPVLLTTVTTVLGMFPLISVSAMWAPLAFTVAFGLIYGTLLTLVYVPLLSYRREVKMLARQAASK